MRNQSLKGEKMEIESLSRLLPKMHFLFNEFFALLRPFFASSRLCSIFYSSFAFQMEMTEFSDDWRFEFQKMHRCYCCLYHHHWLYAPLCYANRDSECIWVGSIKLNGNGKATVTTNKRKPILSFWRLQTLFLQKSRICNWHLCTQRLEISQKVSFYNIESEVEKYTYIYGAKIQGLNKRDGSSDVSPRMYLDSSGNWSMVKPSSISHFLDSLFHFRFG